jgi:hypothetical protein
VEGREKETESRPRRLNGRSACASRVANLQTVNGDHGSLSGENLHAMRAEIREGERGRVVWGAQSNVVRCWHHPDDEGIASQGASSGTRGLRVARTANPWKLLGGLTG